MKELVVELGDRSYPIFIGENLISATELFSEVLQSRQVLIVTNTTIAPLYLTQLSNTLARYNPQSFVIEDGESYKNIEVMNSIITYLLEQRFGRDACLIALGGGVVGDITGFTAACYQRGINYIQVPTTLLSQVDSSVGGKTAVNHVMGKNMIGAFHQPVAVFSDNNVLVSLPDRELKAGLAEVIKYGLIRDESFFVWLENNIEMLLNRDGASLQYAIEQSCRNKAVIVAEDETEKGKRAILNFGHTFGHALETGLNYKDILHGEAVALGMLMAADLSHRSGWLSENSLQRICTIIGKSGLPTSLPVQILNEDIRELMSVDKKARDGQLHLVVLKGIGSAEVSNQYDEKLLSETLVHFSSGRGQA